MSPSSTGAPGTTGCVSNCGITITRSPSPPTQFVKVGYYEGFNLDRPCLTMTADQIPAGYSHVHFSFAGIKSDLSVNLSPGSATQFLLFIKQTGYKKILAFGGWSFSTNTDSTPIFRASYTDADRLKFAQNVATVVNGFGLDGVDFDWEYPGAPDQAGAGPVDGANYLSFLRTVRQLLPANKTISIAAPASYYYLRGFPIAAMAPLLDYIVFMTYDLHGQWDFGKPTAQSGCPAGNCLRSHVNLTETVYTLSMITKAGVPSNKIVVGLASYARSFRMADPSCTGPMCRYTTRGGEPGPCTGAAGYVAQAELETAGTASAAWHDSTSDSDLMTYGNGSWAAYLSDATKARRITTYKALNFGGSAEWAVDLAAFVPSSSSTSTSTAVPTSTASSSTSTASSSTSTASASTSATSTAKA